MKKNHKILIVILVLALVISLLYSFYFKIKPFADSSAYDRVAVNLISGHGYVKDAGNNIQNDLGIAAPGPGYQFFLAGIYKIFGHHWPAVWIIQSLLYVLSGLLVFLTAKKLFTPPPSLIEENLNKTEPAKGAGFSEQGEKIGLIAAALFLFYIDLIEGASLILTETLFIFLLVFTVYLAIKFFQTPNSKNLVLLGLILGLAILTRPTILLFLPVIILFLLFLKEIKLSRRLIYAFLIIVIPALIITPWTYRNYRVYNYFILTTAGGGYNLWAGNHHGANGESDYAPEMTDYLVNKGIVATEKKGKAEFFAFIKSYPSEYLKLLLVKTSKYFSIIRPTGWWPHLQGSFFLPITLIWSVAFSAILFIFGGSGFWLAFKIEKKNLPLGLCQMLLLTIPLSIILTVVGTRYRYPIYPLMAVFAGYFMVHWRQDADKRFYRQIFLIVAGLIIANAVFDLGTNFDIVKEHINNFL